jgi:hypothetical protein
MRERWLKFKLKMNYGKLSRKERKLTELLWPSMNRK